MLLFLMACQAKYTLVRSYITEQNLTPDVSSKAIAFRYEQASYRMLSKKEKKSFAKKKKRPEEIWTISSSGYPSKFSPPQKKTLEYQTGTISKPISQNFIELSQEYTPQKNNIIAQSKRGVIYGPIERISSNTLLLRTQIEGRGEANLASWDIKLHPTSVPVNKKGFVFTPPPYTLEHESTHQSEIDRFSYSQIAFQLPDIPIPFVLSSTLKNIQNNPQYSVLVHPSSIYIGISAPKWSPVQKELTIKTCALSTEGKDASAHNIHIQLVGSSSPQSCIKNQCRFVPDKTGWHQILVTASDERGRRVQSMTTIFIYGPNTVQDAEMLLSHDRKQLLIQSPQKNPHLMLGYLAKEEMFLEGHKLEQGFFIKEHNAPIKMAKALLVEGNESIESCLWERG